MYHNNQQHNRGFLAGGGRGRGYVPGQNPGFSSVAKKARVDPETEFRLRIASLLVQVGDKDDASIRVSIEGLANALSGDVFRSSKRLAEYMVTIVEEMPVKSPLYACLMSNLNTTSFDFVGTVITLVKSNLRSALDQGNERRAVLLTRFVADLAEAGVVVAASPMTILGQFASFLEDANLDDPVEGVTNPLASPRARADFFAGIILAVLPSAAPLLAQRKEKELKALLSHLEAYMAKRPMATSALFVWPSLREGHSDELSQWWLAIQEWRDRGFPPLACMLRPFAEFEARADMHLVGALSMPDRNFIPTGGEFPRPRIIERIVTEWDGPPLPLIERCMLTSYVRHLMYLFIADRKDAAKKILQIPGPVTHLAPIVVETVFGEIFSLPTPTIPLVYCTVLTIELCKNSPVIPIALGKAIDEIYIRSEKMDQESLFKFILFFSHHLSNTNYEWDWESWKDCVDQLDIMRNPASFKSYLVKSVIQHCVRFSFPDRVRGVLPESLHFFIPPEAEAVILAPPPASCPDILDDDDDDDDDEPYSHQISSNSHQISSNSHQISSNLHDGGGAPNSGDNYSRRRRKINYHDEILKILIEKRPDIDFLKVLNSSNLSKIDQLDLSIGLILRAGRKTFSHMTAALTRYGAVLRELTENTTQISSNGAQISSHQNNNGAQISSHQNNNGAQISSNGAQISSHHNGAQVSLNGGQRSEGQVSSSLSLSLKVRILNAVISFWTRSEFISLHTIERLLAANIIDCQSIVQFVFTPDMVDRFDEGFVWEILNIAVKHVVERTKEAKDAVEREREGLLRSRDLASVAQHRLELSLSSLQSILDEERSLFLRILQHITLVLEKDEERSDLWRQMVEGYLLSFTRSHHSSLSNFRDRLSLVFHENCPSKVMKIYDSIKPLLR